MTAPDFPVRIDVDDQVAIVTLDRPPVNAVDRHTLGAIRAAFQSVDDRRDLRAAAFTAAGSRAFMGSVDLGSVADRTIDGRVAMTHVGRPTGRRVNL